MKEEKTMIAGMAKEEAAAKVAVAGKEAAAVPAQEDKTALSAGETAKLQAAHAEELADLRKESAVLYQLALMGAHNPKAAARVLDMSGVAVEAERVIGAEESVRRLMETDPYLFDLRPAPMGGERSSGAVHGEAPRNVETLSDSEYYAVMLKKQK